MSAVAGTPHPDRGSVQSRLMQWRIVVVFVGLFVVISAVAVLIALLAKPTPIKPVCPKHKVCVHPPRGGRVPPLELSSSPRLEFWQAFVNSALGYRFEYPSQLVTTDVTTTSVTVKPPSDNAALIVTFEGAPSSQATPDQLLNDRLNGLRGEIPNLTENNIGAEQILGPEVGYRAGVGGFYQGDLDSPSGLVAPSDVAVMAASDGSETIAVSVISANRDNTGELFGFADILLSTLRFRGDVVQ